MRQMKVFDLTGRTALITGGGSGIGKGCAKILAEAGANVFVIGRWEEKLRTVCMEIRGEGGSCDYFAADLSREENCEAMVKACIERFGRLDILINSAGSRGAHGTLEEEFSEENLKEVMDVDFNSTFWAIKYAYPEFQKNGVGSVINIASLAALSGRGPIVYKAAKGAVRSVSKIFARRFGPLGVRVNTIYPGFIVTEMTEKIHEMAEQEKRMRDESPLGLLGEVEDIGYCALYLAFDAAKFVTGEDVIAEIIGKKYRRPIGLTIFFI